MKRWCDFAAEMPDMAEAGRALIYQFRVGLGYLATIRRDGLLRDGRFALHSYPSPEVDDEFYVTGRTARVDDAAVPQVVYEAYTATGAFTSNDTLFELWLERALHAKYKSRPSWPPVYTKWSAT
jgi:hypothetical protein